MTNSWIVAQNLTFWFGAWCSLLWKIQCGWASQDSSLPAFGEESTPSFQGDPKSSVSYLRSMVFLVARKKKKKSLKGVSKAEHSFVYKNLLGAWNPAKYRISIQRSQVWRETWWMRSLLFRVRDQATSVLALTFQEEICREIKRTKKVNTEQKMPRFEWFIIKEHGVWKSLKKSHSTLRAKRATFYFEWTKEVNEKFK